MDALDKGPQPVPEDSPEVDEDSIILEEANERFKQTYEAHREDFAEAEQVQKFISSDQWPEAIKSARASADRPCLTLDHINQYIRHTVNSGLMQDRDVRVLSMSGDADDKVSEILAGIIRQITQTQTAKVAYETGLRHGCQVGFGYWRVKVQGIPQTNLNEITIRKIKDPRMVLLDPFCEYPDGRDATYGFVMSKLTTKEFHKLYPEAEGSKSWHILDSGEILPWIGEGAMVVAEYYYLDSKGTMKWAILTPDKVLKKGLHHGNVMPIIRVVGEEFEVDGKERKRGMVSPSAMDAQRAYNYSASAFIESAALAPLAPWVAAAGQIEQYKKEWEDSHKVPRSVLRYDPVNNAGVPVPPPQRVQPAGIADGWQGMMTNLIQDTQMIIGLGQPSVMGTGGSPVQSGAGINAQQEPGEINTFHYHEHWHMAIEQTGRVILAMIPHVYNATQAVKITGEDGLLKTAIINPKQKQAVMELQQAVDKATSVSYNVNVGRYDVAISTGPSSASKKMEASKMLMTVVNADPTIMQKAGDLVVEAMDMAGSDVLAKRLRSLLPPGTTEEVTGQVAMLQQAMQENQELKTEMADMEKILMAEREKAQARLMEVNMKNAAEIQQLKIESSADMLQQKIHDGTQLHLATIKSQTELETSTQNNIVKVIIARIQSKSKLDVAVIQAFNKASQEDDHSQRMGGYLNVMEQLGGQEDPKEELVTPPPAPPKLPEPTAPKRMGWHIVRDNDGNMAQIVPIEEAV
jgi:Phage P22-like portal protein